MAYTGAGELDRRITIRAKTTTPGMGGDEVVSFATVFATVWAKVEPAGGGEGFEADQRTNRQRKLFTIRFLEGVGPEMKIGFEGYLWDIKSATESSRGRRHGLEIVAEQENPLPGGSP